MKKKSSKTYDIIDEFNDLGRYIHAILEERKEDRHFEGISLIHGCIEDLLKWLILIQVMWNKSKKEITMPPGEWEAIRDHCNQMNFSQLIHTGLCVELLDYDLHQKLEEIRKDRNQMVHQYWLYVHKGNSQILRKKLEELAEVIKALAGKFESLVEETGMDKSYGLFEIKPGKNLLQ